MPAEVRHFAVTVPRQTALATPQTTALTMPARTVRKIRVRIPPGPNGLVGFQIAMAGVTVIPVNTGEFIIATDEVIEWDVSNLPNSGAWQLRAYNTGQLAHTLYIMFSLDMPGRPGGAILAPPLEIEA